MERYVIRGGREGYERLKVLAQARWPDTAALLDRAGVGPGMRCVDVGCGGGDVTLELARIVGPQGSVFGIDMDEVKLELARAFASEAGLTNVNFQVTNVNDWSDPNAYDVVFCRFLLQHLARPLDLVKKMWAAVRRGGVLVVEDVDFDGLFCEPQNHGFDFYARLFPQAMTSSGGDPRIGRRLHRLFLEAGAEEFELKLVQRVDTSGGEKTMALLTLEATEQAIVDARLATSEEVRAAKASLAQFTEDPTTMIASPRIFQVWSRRA